MDAVEVLSVEDLVVLRARGTEILILATHVEALRKLRETAPFTKYFLEEALLNRPARKLFQAWLRRDGGLWQRLYRTIHTAPAKAVDPPKQPESVVPVSSEAATPEPKSRKGGKEASADPAPSKKASRSKGGDGSKAKDTVVANKKKDTPVKKAVAAAPVKKTKSETSAKPAKKGSKA